MKCWKKALKTGIFIIILIVAVVTGLETVRNKNAHNEEFIENLSNADVLVLGSSHAYNNLNGAVLWNEYGIASACLGQGEQPVSMSYYALKSALTCHKPELVVFEVYMSIAGNEHDEKPEHYVRALLDFPIWRNLKERIEAVSLINAEDKYQYILGFPVYHSDYTADKYGTEESVTAGFSYIFGRKNEGQRDTRCSTDNVSERRELSSYAQEYLVKMIELCKEEDIPLLFLLTPFQADEASISYINTVADIAQEMGVPFVDMNCHVDEIGIDLENEMCDWGHAVVTGSDKNSRWLGAYLSDHYDMADRRTDMAYENWNQIYDEYYQIKRNYIASASVKEPEDYVRQALYDDLFEGYVWLSEATESYAQAETMQMLDGRLSDETYIDFLNGKLYYPADAKPSGLEDVKESVRTQLEEKEEVEIALVVKEKSTDMVIGQAAYVMGDRLLKQANEK